MPRVLIISPHFPPVNAPDMQRVRMSLPHFIDAGWEIHVLTVADSEPMPPVEEALLSTIPPPARIVRVPVLPLRWTRRIGVSNLGWRSLLPYFFVGLRLLRSHRYDLVYFSTTQFILCPLGRIWRALFDVPYVIDLQDPWLNDYYARTGAPAPGGWKHNLAMANARLLEGWTLRRCAHIIAVSAVYIDELARRYPWFDRAHSSVLTFGAPDADFEALRATESTARRLLPDNGQFKIAYAGRLGPDMLPALEVLFAAVALLRDRGQRVELYFFGTSYARSGRGEATTTALATRHGIADRVQEKPDRIGYLDALRLLQQSDATLLLGSEDRAYSPSKVYPTLTAGRPTLALAPAGSVLELKIRELGGAALVAFSANHQTTSVEQAATVLGNLIKGEPLIGALPLDRDRLQRAYSARAIAAAQLTIFNQLLRQRHAAWDDAWDDTPTPT